MDHPTRTADWVVPAILAGAGILLAVTLGVTLFILNGGNTEPDGLAAELETYTRCLNEHGADVPVVEAQRDGGFSVTVSGALIEHGPDPSAMWAAHGACSDVAPDIFNGLLDGLLGGMLGGFDGGGLLDGIIGEVLENA